MKITKIYNHLHCFFLLDCVNAIVDKIWGQAHTKESKLNLFHFIDMSSLTNKSPNESFGGKVLITPSTSLPPFVLNVFDI